MNPIALVEKAINEHGSSVILHERLALASQEFDVLGRKLADAEAKIVGLNAKIVDLLQTIRQLTTDKECLYAELKQAHVKIRDLENQLARPDDQPLDEPKHRIISALAKGSLLPDNISECTGLSWEAIQYHLADPRMATFVHTPYLSFRELTVAGRQYAVAHGLLSVT